MASGLVPQNRPFTSKGEFQDVYKQLFATFASGKTKSLKWRKWQLKQFWWMIEENEKAITDALSADLNKHALESLLYDIGTLKHDVLNHIAKLEEWAADEPVREAGFLYGTLGKARIRKEPLGVALIVGAWNFPLLLTLQPVVAAIAAGCCSVIKPSELSVVSQDIMVDLVARYLDPTAIRVVTGGPEETTYMLEHKFNHIFFTGSTKVAKYVAAAAAKHLTPCVYELGGQGPAVVTKSADVNLAAKRIAYAKFINSGQICLSVNHVFVDPSVHDEFVEKLKFWLGEFHGSGHMAKVVNQRNYDRLDSMLAKTGGQIVSVGASSRDEYKLAPQIVLGVDMQDPILSEELFGPVCPVIKADSRGAIDRINALPHPLALYIFGRNKQEFDYVIENTISGGVCINDHAMHFVVPGAPFGGVGDSGSGAYHGKYGFDAFTHLRTIVEPPTWLDRFMGFRYPPFDMSDQHNSLVAVKNTLGFKKGETIEDQKIGGSGKGWMVQLAAVAVAGVGLAASGRVGDWRRLLKLN